MAFGGGGISAPTPIQQATQDQNKGATDAQKTKKQLQKDFGLAMMAERPGMDKFMEDTTLSSGSLLALGSNLGA